MVIKNKFDTQGAEQESEGEIGIWRIAGVNRVKRSAKIDFQGQAE
jgi:hypothetical protein